MTYLAMITAAGLGFLIGDARARRRRELDLLN